MWRLWIAEHAHVSRRPGGNAECDLVGSVQCRSCPRACSSASSASSRMVHVPPCLSVASSCTHTWRKLRVLGQRLWDAAHSFVLTKFPCALLHLSNQYWIGGLTCHQLVQDKSTFQCRALLLVRVLDIYHESCSWKQNHSTQRRRGNNFNPK